MTALIFSSMFNLHFAFHVMFYGYLLLVYIFNLYLIVFCNVSSFTFISFICVDRTLGGTELTPLDVARLNGCYRII